MGGKDQHLLDELERARRWQIGLAAVLACTIIFFSITTKFQADAYREVRGKLSDYRAQVDQYRVEDFTRANESKQMRDALLQKMRELEEECKR